MPHGRPDWLLTSATRQTFPLTDLGELAARLGSIVTFDRRGDVVFLDGFEDGLIKWSQATSGTGAAVAVDTANARNGAQSIKLTGGSDTGRSAQITHRQPVQLLGSVGVEVSFYYDSQNDNLSIQVTLNDGQGTWDFEVRYTQSTSLLEYLDSGGAFQTLDDSKVLTQLSKQFHTLKVVLDMSTMTYRRVLLDSSAYDLSGIGGSAGVVGNSPEVTATVRQLSRAGSNDALYVDDAIFTQNEP